MKATVYCVVVTYNGMHWLPRTLLSIRKSDYPLKTIVVDNGSTDTTCTYISKTFPEVHLIQIGSNLGFGEANNLGVKVAIDAGSDYIFLLNQDAFLYQNTIRKCMEVFKLDSRIGLISPIHLNGKGDALDSGFQTCLSDNLCPSFVSDLALGFRKQFYTIYSVNAAAWMLKAPVIKEIGLFSPAFFHYGEDINFQHRLRYFDYRAVLIPDAFISHDRDQRKGEKSPLGKKIELRTNQMTILMNINESYPTAMRKIWKYAGLLVFEGKFLSSVCMVVDTFIHRRRYRRWREEMRKGLSF